MNEILTLKGGAHNVKAARKNVKHASRALHNGSVISELRREKMYVAALRLWCMHTPNWDKHFSRANGAAGLEVERGCVQFFFFF